MKSAPSAPPPPPPQQQQQYDNGNHHRHLTVHMRRGWNPLSVVGHVLQCGRSARLTRVTHLAGHSHTQVIARVVLSLVRLVDHRPVRGALPRAVLLHPVAVPLLCQRRRTFYSNASQTSCKRSSLIYIVCSLCDGLSSAPYP